MESNEIKLFLFSTSRKKKNKLRNWRRRHAIRCGWTIVWSLRRAGCFDQSRTWRIHFDTEVCCSRAALSLGYTYQRESDDSVELVRKCWLCDGSDFSTRVRCRKSCRIDSDFWQSFSTKRARGWYDDGAADTWHMAEQNCWGCVQYQWCN